MAEHNDEGRSRPSESTGDPRRHSPTTIGRGESEGRHESARPPGASHSLSVDQNPNETGDSAPESQESTRESTHKRGAA